MNIFKNLILSHWIITNSPDSPASHQPHNRNVDYFFSIAARSSSASSGYLFNSK